ncbi:hypothetical protein P7K49_036296 [Saguinus oedipus]|uniref:Uncharacterized protein n=1 Tax=Saguinus oedipus TaxID=9490 RepID=A0ABQ9TK07_SAGOE|nr:hypothetical protein P7K49_036296 [Saguinus oedipus]
MGFGPGHARDQQQGRHRLVEKEVAVNELLLLLRIRPALVCVVRALQVAVQARGHSLRVPAEAEAASLCTVSSAEPRPDGRRPAACWGCAGSYAHHWAGSAVQARQYGAKEILEQVVGLLVTRHAPFGPEYEWPRLSTPVWMASPALTTPGTQLRDQLGQRLGHWVVVAAQVGKLVLHPEA